MQVSGECAQLVINLAAQIMRLPSNTTPRNFAGNSISTGKQRPFHGQHRQEDPVQTLNALGLLRLNATQHSLTVEGMRTAAALMSTAL